jgi:hypothetical protein
MVWCVRTKGSTHTYIVTKRFGYKRLSEGMRQETDIIYTTYAANSARVVSSAVRIRSE